MSTLQDKMSARTISNVDVSQLSTDLPRGESGVTPTTRSRHHRQVTSG